MEAKLIAGVLLIRAVLLGMRTRRCGRIVDITSAMAKTQQAAMGLSVAHLHETNLRLVPRS